jgi:hypothetical protein
MSRRVCSVEGCNEKHDARGLCHKHYWRWKRNGHTSLKYESHGMNGTRIYLLWASMKARCSNENDPRFKNYGGRGITVCDEWRNSFSAFYRDMGDPPTDKHEIDRLDNDDNYCKENCAWRTHEENTQHTRRTKLTIEKARIIKHSDRPNQELADEFGVHNSQISRIKSGKHWKNA